MEKSLKKIAIITSGGDAPGMNAAIRSVVRTCVYKGITPMGFYKGYDGLINGKMIELNARSVKGIINKGGTILKTARSKDFRSKEGRDKAYKTLKSNNIDGLIAIGGDGTFTGGLIFGEENNFPVIGIPATIDNDIFGTSHTIGFDSACNTVMNAIDKIRDTAANRGSILHRIVENHITDTKHLDLTDMGQEAHKMADILIESAIETRLSEVWGVEPYLAYQGLFAGQTDLIGIHDGKITVCDHKNANKPKKKEWLHDSYRIQLAAYATAHNQVYGTSIQSGTILMCTKDNYFQKFTVQGPEFQKYMWEWLRRVDLYYEKRSKLANNHE